MKVKILGIQDVNMKDDTGKVIDGLSLYCCDADDMSDGNFVGRRAAKVFVPRNLTVGLNIMLNSVVDLIYTQPLDKIT